MTVDTADIDSQMVLVGALSDYCPTNQIASRARRTSANDADRLRKYLARFSLDWARVSQG